MKSPLHHALMRVSVPARLGMMARIQARREWGLTQIQAYQDEKLRELIGYCWRYVPYYRKKWSSAIKGPEDIQTVKDLQYLPILTKDELRNELEGLTTRAPHVKSEPARSGGSTGRPTSFRMTKYDQEVCWAQIYTGWTWAGYEVGDAFLTVGGESLGIGLSDRRTWKDWVVHRWGTSGSNLTADRARVLAQSPHFERIRLIYGYPNSIRELGELLAQIPARPLRLAGIVCTAEVMRPEVRQRLNQIFGPVAVHDQYGLNDGGLLAVEGPDHDGLHVFFHRALLEIVDDHDRQIMEVHQPGRAIATSLTNLGTPFVRYETGDDVHWSSFDPAPSGIGWPRIGPVDGRTGDVIFLPSGRRIPMPGLTLVMRWLDGLHQYQFIQTGPSAVTVRLDRGPSFAMSEADVMAYLSSKIGSEIDWTISWGPPELTANAKLLIIRNDWLRAQGVDRPPAA